MFIDQEAVDIFPFPVWLFEVEPEKADGINRSSIAALTEMRIAVPESRPGDHWQSRNDLQELSEFSDLKAVIEAAATDVFQQQGIEYDSFLITGCWANVRPTGSEHPPHTHPNNYLSGSYYVQTPQGGDVIGFRDPRPETNIIAPRILEQTKYNARTVVFPVRAGVLIMFPSWLPHFVPPNQGDTERISISFNIMFGSFAEQISRPKWTFDAAQKAPPPC